MGSLRAAAVVFCAVFVRVQFVPELELCLQNCKLPVTGKKEKGEERLILGEIAKNGLNPRKY